MIYALLILVILVCGYVIWNLNNKLTKAEDIIEEQIDYLRKVSLTIQESNLYVNQLDEKGHFRADDEIGTFFDFMKEIQDLINSFRLPKGYGKKETDQQ
jgi:hypothetical protein